MHRSALVVVALVLVACSSRGAGPAASHPAAAERRFAGVPDRVGDFALTERSAIEGLSGDSLFRFSDGSTTNLSVIVYDVSDDVKVDPDPQKWTAVEGEKFGAVQEVRRRRGQIADYVVSFSDTARVPVAGGTLLEHSVGVPVRSPAGAISVELQYLYLIGGKFVKVRATIPEQGWQQSNAPTFARELARHLAGGS